mgnify:CR=1 FL=1
MSWWHLAWDDMVILIYLFSFIGNVVKVINSESRDVRLAHMGGILVGGLMMLWGVFTQFL